MSSTDPEFALAHSNRGTALNLLRRHEEALAACDRALALDESFDAGAIHVFLITYEMSRQGRPGDPAARARAHFERAMTLSEGKDAAPLVALAEAVAIQQQDVKAFESLLNRALAIDPTTPTSTRGSKI